MKGRAVFKRQTDSKTIRCPACGGATVSVIDSRAGPNNSVRRRRVCACGERFTTYEMIRSDVELSFEEIDDMSLLLATALERLDEAYGALEKLRASRESRARRLKGFDDAEGIAAGTRDAAERC